MLRIGAVNADFVADYLFSVNILNEEDNLELSVITDRAEKIRKLQVLLRSEQHPQASEALCQAIARETYYKRVVDKKDADYHRGEGELIIIYVEWFKEYTFYIDDFQMSDFLDASLFLFIVRVETF
jgi:hypothetical protein